MIDAIGTVLFWAAAVALAFVTLIVGMLLLAGIFALIAAPFRAMDEWSQQRAERPVSKHLRHMTPEQRYQWANRIGPYADA
jgi:hypothetical protein